MKINEIFYSIQGEGRWMGIPMVFLRTTGCNLRCQYCDTTYAYDDGEDKSCKDILKDIIHYNCSYLCITGGEPLIQQNLKDILINLSKNNYQFIIETNGTKSIKPYAEFNHLSFSMDVKCPSSKMHQYTDFSNIGLLKPSDQLKCIIGSEEDYDYAKKIIRQYQPDCLIFFQPVFGFSIQKLASWILDEHLPVRLGIQLHKYIWGKDTKK